MMEIKHVNNNMAIIAKTHSLIIEFCSIVLIGNELPDLENFISSLMLDYDTYIYVIFDLVSNPCSVRI